MDLPRGLEFNDTDLYTRLMDKENTVLKLLDDKMTGASKERAFDSTFFSMTLSEFGSDFITGMSKIAAKLVVAKSVRDFSNKDIFYMGLVAILVALLIILCETT
jgi:hypothetical protein